MTASPAQTFARKVECEEDGLYFNRYFFKQRFDSKMIVSGHHHAMQRLVSVVENFPVENRLGIDLVAKMVVGVQVDHRRSYGRR